MWRVWAWALAGEEDFSRANPIDRKDASNHTGKKNYHFAVLAEREFNTIRSEGGYNFRKLMRMVVGDSAGDFFSEVLFFFLLTIFNLARKRSSNKAPLSLISGN